MTTPLTLEQRLCNQIARNEVIAQSQDDLICGLLSVDELNAILANTPARDWSELDEYSEQPGLAESGRW